MIYASLKAIPAWKHRLVAPGYVLLGLATGAVLNALICPVCLALVFHECTDCLRPLHWVLGLATAETARYWQSIDNARL